MKQWFESNRFCGSFLSFDTFLKMFNNISSYVLFISIRMCVSNLAMTIMNTRFFIWTLNIFFEMISIWLFTFISLKLSLKISLTIDIKRLLINIKNELNNTFNNILTSFSISFITMKKWVFIVKTFDRFAF